MLVWNADAWGLGPYGNALCLGSSVNMVCDHPQNTAACSCLKGGGRGKGVGGKGKGGLTAVKPRTQAAYV